MKTAFLFSGQGSQYPGMMKELADISRAAKEVFLCAGEVLGRDIERLCFEGTKAELDMTHNTQPCVLAADLAAYAAFQELTGFSDAESGPYVTPDAMAGFSLGEYAALTAAGVLQMEEAFRLVQKRADLMQESVPAGKGAMAAVMGLSEGEVKDLCREAGGYVIPANHNCPGQIVVSGEADAVGRLMQIARRRKIRSVRLQVSAPFHCELMRPAAEKLQAHLNGIGLQTARVPVYMNVDGKPETDPQLIREKLISQTWSPVQWIKTVQKLNEDGIDTFMEFGPGRTLSGFVKKTLHGRRKALSVSDLTSLHRAILAEI